MKRDHFDNRSFLAIPALFWGYFWYLAKSRSRKRICETPPESHFDIQNFKWHFNWKPRLLFCSSTKRQSRLRMRWSANKEGGKGRTSQLAMLFWGWMRITREEEDIRLNGLENWTDLEGAHKDLRSRAANQRCMKPFYWSVKYVRKSAYIEQYQFLPP